MRNKRLRQIAEWIVAVLVALIVWFYVISDQNPMIEKSISVPVKYKNVGQGLTVVEPLETIRITVRSSRDHTNDLKSSNFEANFDLKGLQDGIYNLHATFIAPDKAEIIDDGSEQRIKLERTIERQVVLELRKSTESIRPYLVKEIVKPDFVLIKGVKSAVDKIKAAIVTVDMGLVDQSSSLELQPQLVDVDGKEVKGVIETVPSKVPVVINYYAEKVVPIHVIVSGNLAGGTTLATPSTVTVFGDRAKITAIAEVNTETVNARDLITQRNMSAKLIMPEEGELVGNLKMVQCTYNKGGND